MKKPDTIETDDITTQHYKGPGALAAGLGDGAVHGKTLLAGGFLLGGALSLLFPNEAKSLAKSAQAGVKTMHESKNFLVKFGGLIFKTALSFGKELGTLTTETKFIKKRLDKFDKGRVAITVEGAIVTSAAASLIGGFTGLFTGTRASHRGKKQFESAKEEILSLRATNDRLRTKLVDTELALEDLKTVDAAKHGILNVAHDDTPKITPSDEQVPTSQVNSLDHLGVATPGLAISRAE